MTENDFDLAARAWLDDGPTRMSDRAVQSALDEVHTTRQRRPWRPAWRAPHVSNFTREAIAAILVVAVGLLAVSIVPRGPDRGSVGGPLPSTSPSATPALDFPPLTTTFVSPRNGFSIKHPGRVAITRARQLWGFNKQVDDGFDVVETGLAAVFKGASTDLGSIPAGSFRTIDARIDEYLAEESVSPGGCGIPRSDQAEITIDGQPARIAECPNRIEVTVVADGRLYLFTLASVRPDARAVFDAFAATIDLTPETAVRFPAMETTFVSPTYGYSFRFHDRGGLAPAKERWDPVGQLLAPRNLGDWFDGVETGLGAYFQAASTPIPDGVSIDDWVDEYVTSTTAGGCGVPRRQQAVIAIDGRLGTVAACDHSEATVVAGGRLYLFTGPHDDRGWFDAWITTIDLRPEDAAAPTSTPSPT